VPREDAIAIEGIVIEVIGNGLFRIELANGHRVLAHTARKDKARLSGVVLGDRVRLEMSPFDMSEGQIVV
jgi:translation initiation factor IF-1